MRKNVFGILVAVFLIATLALSAVTPSVFAQGGPTPTPTGTGLWTEQTAIDLYNISGTYAVAECEYEGRVEPSCLKFTGSVQMVNPFDLWVDGYRKCGGEIRDAYAGMQRADRISIPPGYTTTQECFVEILIARPWPPTQQNSLELRGDNETQWSLVEEAERFFELTGPDAEILRHGVQSWEVPEVENESWSLTNVCDNWLDGFRVLPGEVRPDFTQHPEGPRVGIPPHSYAVSAMMVTLRPCDEPQMFSLSPLGSDVNIRAEPSLEATIVGSITQGTTAASDGYVTIEEKQWYRVWLKSGPAWVAGWVVNVTPITTAPAAAQPVPAAQPVQPAPADWSEATVRSLFAIPANTALEQCAGETNCWIVRSVPTVITNGSGCWQDGYRAEAGEPRPGQEDPKVGIPSGFTGLVEAATLRPCG